MHRNNKKNITKEIQIKEMIRIFLAHRIQNEVQPKKINFIENNMMLIIKPIMKQSRNMNKLKRINTLKLILTIISRISKKVDKDQSLNQKFTKSIPQKKIVV